MNSINYQYTNGRNNNEHWRYNSATMTIELTEKHGTSMLRIELKCAPTEHHSVDSWKVTVKEAYLGDQYHSGLNIYLSQKLLATEGSVTLGKEDLSAYRIGYLVSEKAESLPQDIASWLNELLHSDMKFASGF